jgi:hypothetical protein
MGDRNAADAAHDWDGSHAGPSPFWRIDSQAAEAVRSWSTGPARGHYAGGVGKRSVRLRGGKSTPHAKATTRVPTPPRTIDPVVPKS